MMMFISINHAYFAPRRENGRLKLIYLGRGDYLMLIMNGRRLTAGTLSDTTDSSTQYLWQCTGSNGGTAASCSLPVPQTSTKFTQGDRVRVTETMNVRAGASANSALRGAQPAGGLVC